MAIISSKGIKKDGEVTEELKIKREVTTRINSKVTNKRNLNVTSESENKGRFTANPGIAKPKREPKGANPLEKVKQKRRQPVQGRPVQQGNEEVDPNLEEEDDTGEDEQRQNQEEEEKEESSNQSGNQDGEEGEGTDSGKGNGLGKKLFKFLMKHPIILLYALLILLGFILIILFIGFFVAIIGGVEVQEEYKKNYGPFFAFSDASISLVDNTGTESISRRSLSLGEYVKGIVYVDTMSVNLSNMSDDKKIEFYKAMLLTRKAEVLSRGNYNNKTKQMTLRVNDFNYCDVYLGCKMVSRSGSTFYLSNELTLTVDNTIREYGAMDTTLVGLLSIAYNETTSEIITPSNFKEPLTSYKGTPPTMNSSLISLFNTGAASDLKYKDLVRNFLSGYKVYNLDDYVEQYESIYLSSFSYWWPIGSVVPDANGNYSDDPSDIAIISRYGPSFSDGTINKGMKINGICGSSKVIAPADGRVSYVGNNEKYGTYIIIDHEDGVKTLLGSLTEGSVNVSVNQNVNQGQLIGVVGRIDDTSPCALYIEMYANGINVNPLEYISSENPRPSAAKYIKFVQGTSNKQTVCKTLLATGFNKNAVAGLMANIEHESGFRLDALSDGGTSNGLFQWHKGRLDNLKKYCGNEYLTSIKCQLDFLMYEITESPNAQGGIYNYLMGNHSAYEMGYEFCARFERPAGGAESANNRGNLAESKYVSYVNNGCN